MSTEGVMSPVFSFCEWSDKGFLERVKDVLMILQIYGNVEVYYGGSAGIFVWLCAEISLYVGSYDNVDEEDEHKAEFLQYVPSLT